VLYLFGVGSLVNLVLRNATSCSPCARAKAACKLFDVDGARRKAKDETARRAQARKTKQRTDAVKGAKGTISLAQAKDVVPGPNCNAKEFVGINQE